MFTDSDDSSSAEGYSSPEDADYKTSDDDNGGDSDDEDEIDFDGDSDAAQKAKSRAVREGFSLVQTGQRNASPDAHADDPSWLSTQPASQPSSTKPRRTSPRGKPAVGITNAIVGVIRGEATAMESISIPKKKRFQQQQQLNEPSHSNAPPASTESNERLKSQQKQPPMKKRKVSLSPTDSLAKHRASNSNQNGSEVIDLLADDDGRCVESPLSRKADASNASRIVPDVQPKRLSPAMLAAAKKQQQEHIEATKKKRHQEQEQLRQSNNLERNGSNDTSRKKETTGPKRASKVSGVSLAESLPNNNCLDNKSVAEVPLPKNKKSRSKNKDDSLPSAKKTKGKNSAKTIVAKPSKEPSTASKRSPKPTKKAIEPITEDAAGKAAKPARGKTIERTASKTHANGVAPKGATTAKRKSNGTSTDTGDTQAATTAKPPPKKKKKRTTFEHELLRKMFLSCRPYSLKDLVQLMGKTTSEASVNFCLLSLVDKGWVLKKEFRSGSRTKELYWANQECRDTKLWALDCLRFPDAGTIRETRQDLAALQQRHKDVIRETETVEATPSNERLSVLCQTAQREVDALSTKLEAMKGRISSAGGGAGGVAGIKGRPALGTHRGNLGGRGAVGLLQQRGRFSSSHATKKKPTPLQLKKRINAMREQWIKRKRKCMDFVDALADGMEKKVKDVVRKVLELETDEDEQAVLPPKHAV